MTEHPLTGPNRALDEQTGDPVMPQANVHAAIAALGLQDDMNRIGDIHLEPHHVTVTYYEMDEGKLTIRDTEHGRTVNTHQVVFTIRDTREWNEQVVEYRRLVAEGMSDAEARATVWREVAVEEQPNE